MYVLAEYTVCNGNIKNNKILSFLYCITKTRRQKGNLKNDHDPKVQSVAGK